jgi:hypothetical protein
MLRSKWKLGPVIGVEEMGRREGRVLCAKGWSACGREVGVDAVEVKTPRPAV